MTDKPREYRVARLPDWYRRLIYESMRVVMQWVFVFVYRYRVWGNRWLPPSGPVVVLANHASNLDPLLVGVLFRRPVRFLSKHTLFINPFVRHIVTALGALPIDRRRGLDGLRLILSALESGEAIAIFPEGTRSRTGELQPFKSGFAMTARRSRATIVPVYVEGAYRIWPAGRWLPRPTQLMAIIGDHLPPESYADWDDARIVQWAEQQLRDAQSRLRP